MQSVQQCIGFISISYLYSFFLFFFQVFYITLMWNQPNVLLLKNFLLQDYATYVNIIIYYSFCVKTGSDRLKPSQEIKGALQRWFWWSWYSCMSSLYGLFGEVSYCCTLPFSMLKKCKKKSMASSWYSAANHSLIHFLQDYLFATFSHIGIHFFCHCIYTCVQIQTSFNLCQKN